MCGSAVLRMAGQGGAVWCVRGGWVLLETVLEITEYLINLHHRRMGEMEEDEGIVRVENNSKIER